MCKRLVWTLCAVVLNVITLCACYGQQKDLKGLNRDLISAVKQNLTQTAIDLLDQGADVKVTTTLEESNPLEGPFWKDRESTKGQQVNLSILHLLISAHQWGHKGSLPFDNPELAEALLKRGANPNAQDGAGVTPLHLACAWNFPKTVNLLLTYHADPNQKDKAGQTPLIAAAYASKVLIGGNVVDSVRLLVKHGADVNATDNEGKTALMYVVIDNYAFRTQFVQFLLQNGAKVSIKDKQGKTALDYSKESNQKDVIFPQLEAALKKEHSSQPAP